MLLSLPPELLIRVLSYIGRQDIPSLFSVFPPLRSLVNDSQPLLYQFAAQAIGIENNGYNKQGASERLSTLRKLEEGWYQFHICAKSSIPVDHTASGIYDLTGGMYLLGDASTRKLHYCKLPNVEDVGVEWSVVEIDVPRSILDIGLCTFEHDLVAIVTTTPHTSNSEMHVIEVVLLEISTDKPHPLANQPILFVCESKVPRPSIGIEIVDSTLALVVFYGEDHADLPVMFYTFDWQTGYCKSEFKALHGTYSSVIFLSPSLVLLSNSRGHSLDVFTVPPASTTGPSSTSDTHDPTVPKISPSPIVSLKLPAIRPAVFSSLIARCEPNPTGPSGNRFSKSPFHTKAEDAIMILNIMLGTVGEMTMWSMYSMFAHRSALVNIVEKHRAMDVSATQTQTMESNNGSTSTVPWDSWGPPVTRWFNSEEMPTRWITTSCGQRCVFSIEADPEDDEDDDDLGDERGTPIDIIDFNRLRIDRALFEEGKRKAEAENTQPDDAQFQQSTHDGGELITLENEDDTLEDDRDTLDGDHDILEGDLNSISALNSMEVGEFEEEEIGIPKPMTTPSVIHDRLFVDGMVESRLPYMRISRFGGEWGKFRFAGVLMDEERLIGIRTNAADEITDLEVLHIGDPVQRWDWVE